MSPLDLGQPVLCANCKWRSRLRRARIDADQVARCPECNRPVIVDSPELTKDVKENDE